MSAHTIQELQQYQALTLEQKIEMTKARIKAWVDHYGIDGVYVSFSGGKDSTVLLHIARQIYPNIKAMFVDVPTQYPELRSFVEKFDNVDIMKSKKSFMEVCEKYGFPMISKEVSESVQGARKYLTSILQSETGLTDRQTDRRHKYSYFYERVTGTGKYSKFSSSPSIDEIAMKQGSRGGYDNKYRKLKGIGEYSKRTNDRKKGRGESATCDHVGNADKKQGKSDKGEYP